eukprot:SAG31_NODE_7033_length_1809_cov_1.126316_1_plen_115_part_00
MLSEAPNGNEALPAKSNVDRKQLGAIPYKSVINFTNHYVEQNVLRPWKMDDPRTARGTGFYIGDKRILTNAHVVHEHTSIRLERCVRGRDAGRRRRGGGGAGGGGGGRSISTYY